MRLNTFTWSALAILFEQPFVVLAASIPVAEPVPQITISERNVLKSTARAHFIGLRDERAHPVYPRDNGFPLELVNNRSETLRAYIQGRDKSDALGFVTSQGEFYTPQAPTEGFNIIPDQTIAIEIPPGETKSIAMQGDLTSGRAYFAEEQNLKFSTLLLSNGTMGLVNPTAANANDESANTTWGFAEFTYTSDQGLTINPSYVDFVPSISISVSGTDDSGETYITPGMPTNALEEICSKLGDQSDKDGQAWKDLCIRDSSNNIILRVLSPNIYRSPTHDPTAFEGYFEPYVEEAWSRYSSSGQSLHFDTQNKLLLKNVTCNLNSTASPFTCDNEGEKISKPSTADILSCSTGAFANVGSTAHTNIVARSCAALTRGTIIPPTNSSDAGVHSNVQPNNEIQDDKYYQNDICNHYARIVHETLPEGRGYAFPYDDVNPTILKDQIGKGADGTIKLDNPKSALISIG